MLLLAPYLRPIARPQRVVAWTQSAVMLDSGIEGSMDAEVMGVGGGNEPVMFPRWWRSCQRETIPSLRRLGESWGSFPEAMTYGQRVARALALRLQSSRSAAFNREMLRVLQLCHLQYIQDN